MVSYTVKLWRYNNICKTIDKANLTILIDRT